VSGPVPFAHFCVASTLPSFFPFSVCPCARGLFPLPASVCPNARLAALSNKQLHKRRRRCRRQRARSGKEARCKRKFCRALLPILRGRWSGVLACLLAQSQQPPSRLSVRARALSLTHSLSLSLSFVESVACVPIFGACVLRK
jgi:hypothetical protein